MGVSVTEQGRNGRGVAGVTPNRVSSRGGAEGGMQTWILAAGKFGTDWKWRLGRTQGGTNLTFQVGKVGYST